MQERIAPTQNDVLSFIYCIKTGSVQEISKQINTYTSEIVSRLQLQSRQPALHFSALILDHDKAYKVMKMLLDAGANPHYKDHLQQTVLFYICREGNVKCFELLDGLNVNVDEVDMYGQTPIYYAASKDRLNILDRMIGRVDLNRVDQIAKQTPLFYAAKEGHLQMCRRLVEAGCDITIQDNYHKTALHYAKTNSRVDVVEYLTNEMSKHKEKKKPVVSLPKEDLLQNNASVNGDSQSEKVRQEKNKTEKQQKSNKKKQQNGNHNKPNYRLFKVDSQNKPIQVPIEQLRDLLKIYPDLQKILGNPDAIEQAQLDDQKNKDKDNWQKVANRIMNSCWKYKGAHVFHEPVNPERYGILDYFQIIKNPMDFGTIKKRISTNAYKNINEFVSDMRLVFENCILYNGLENTVSKCAMEIREHFESSCRINGVPLSQ